MSLEFLKSAKILFSSFVLELFPFLVIHIFIFFLLFFLLLFLNLLIEISHFSSCKFDILCSLEQQKKFWS